MNETCTKRGTVPKGLSSCARCASTGPGWCCGAADATKGRRDATRKRDTSMVDSDGDED